MNKLKIIKIIAFALLSAQVMPTHGMSTFFLRAAGGRKLIEQSNGLARNGLAQHFWPHDIVRYRLGLGATHTPAVPARTFRLSPPWPEKILVRLSKDHFAAMQRKVSKAHKHMLKNIWLFGNKKIAGSLVILAACGGSISGGLLVRKMSIEELHRMQSMGTNDLYFNIYHHGIAPACVVTATGVGAVFGGYAMACWPITLALGAIGFGGHKAWQLATKAVHTRTAGIPLLDDLH